MAATAEKPAAVGGLWTAVDGVCRRTGRRTIWPSYGGTQFPARYRNGAFIAFHGSPTAASTGASGAVVSFVPMNEAGQVMGEWEIFAGDFDRFPTSANVAGRPSGLADRRRRRALHRRRCGRANLEGDLPQGKGGYSGWAKRTLLRAARCAIPHRRPDGSSCPTRGLSSELRRTSLRR